MSIRMHAVQRSIVSAHGWARIIRAGSCAAVGVSVALTTTSAIAQPTLGPLVLRQHVLPDGGRNVAHSHTILAPRGWRVEGGAWYATQALFNVYPSHQIKVESPDGLQVRLLPSLSMQDYLPSPYTGQQRPAEMQIVKGQPILYLPDSLDGWSRFIREKSIAQSYPDAFDVEVDTAVVEPDLTQMLQQRNAAAYQQAAQLNAAAQQNGLQSFNFADARFLSVRARYTHQGYRWEELFGFGVALTGVDTPFGRQIWWWLDPVVALRAPLGRLDESLPLLVTVAGTMRMTDEWARWRADLVGQLLRIGREIAEDDRRTAANISRIISNTHSEVTDIMNRGFRARSAMNERGQERAVNAVRGTEQYVGGGSSVPVELPANYANVYTNGNGEYLLTDDRFYDPNRDPNLQGDWQAMQIRR